jgi:hypothetical protein
MLGTLREEFYRCASRRADALFELTDAILTAGSVPSVPHLSLAEVHSRRWGSLYAVLSKGRFNKRRRLSRTNEAVHWRAITSSSQRYLRTSGEL